MENNWKNKNFFIALKNALNGIKYVFVNEKNLKIQLLIGIIVVLFGLLLKISLIEWGIVVTIIFMVFFSEIVNTAIENVVDMITIEYSEKAKIAKDVSAGAVVLSAFNAIIIAIFIMIGKIG